MGLIQSTKAPTRDLTPPGGGVRGRASCLLPRFHGWGKGYDSDKGYFFSYELVPLRAEKIPLGWGVQMAARTEAVSESGQLEG